MRVPFLPMEIPWGFRIGGGNPVLSPCQICPQGARNQTLGGHQPCFGLLRSAVAFGEPKDKKEVGR